MGIEAIKEQYKKTKGLFGREMGIDERVREKREHFSPLSEVTPMQCHGESTE